MIIRPRTYKSLGIGSFVGVNDDTAYYFEIIAERYGEWVVNLYFVNSNRELLTAVNLSKKSIDEYIKQGIYILLDKNPKKVKRSWWETWKWNIISILLQIY